MSLSSLVSKVENSEIEKSKKHWNNDNVPVKKKVKPGVILPVDGEENILVTAALPYVNNVPHLGNIIGCVLSADVFTRYCRLVGHNVLYISGTDEYGTATETKALLEGVTPQQICDKYNKIHSDCYKWFNISFDHFGRTTRPDQRPITHSIFWKLEENGKIIKKSVEQLFCERCSKFLADRFVEGTCPLPGCGYADARGDQCDGCSKLVNAVELKDPKCKVCSNTPVIKTSNHLFLDLAGIEEKVKEWSLKTADNWSANAKGICESWLRDGLKERCITRDLKWGTPVPYDGFKNKVFYVWFDAPIGYISMTMEYTTEWEKWWKNPENVKYYEFMAKDNVPFHSVIFPACLMATGQNWTKVTHLMATEYLNYEDGKFSKSRGVGVFGDQIQNTPIPSDVWRFYLLYIRPEGHDSSFSWTDLQSKNNSELLNNLGNFLNRSLKFLDNSFQGQVPQSSPISEDFKYISLINKELIEYHAALSTCKLKDGIKSLLTISAIGNLYIQDMEPYKLIKEESSKIRAATVTAIAANIVPLLALLLEPYMPELSRTILKILNNPVIGKLPTAFYQILKPGHKINKPYPLINKIDDKMIEDLRKMFSGQQKQQKKFVAPIKQSETTFNVASEAAPASQNGEGSSPEELERLVTEQGNIVRDLKGGGAAKDEIASAIEKLLCLKEDLARSKGLDPATVRQKPKKGKKK